MVITFHPSRFTAKFFCPIGTIFGHILKFEDSLRTSFERIKENLRQKWYIFEETLKQVC
jgi:hypothetical protein